MKPEYIKGVIREPAGNEDLEIDILIVHLKDLGSEGDGGTCNSD
jgi:hypothetical protein